MGEGCLKPLIPHVLIARVLVILMVIKIMTLKSLDLKGATLSRLQHFPSAGGTSGHQQEKREGKSWTSEL